MYKNNINLVCVFSVFCVVFLCVCVVFVCLCVSVSVPVLHGFLAEQFPEISGSNL